MKRDSRLSNVLHALLHMAEMEGPATSEAMAQAMQTNPVVVRRLMAGLRYAGFVTSAKGHGGGWVLSCPLTDITLRVEPGERLAIVGASGSGKSTLALLLARFYDPASGQIRIDGQDLRDCSVGSIRRAVGLVFEEGQCRAWAHQRHAEREDQDRTDVDGKEFEAAHGSETDAAEIGPGGAVDRQRQRIDQRAGPAALERRQPVAIAGDDEQQADIPVQIDARIERLQAALSHGLIDDVFWISPSGSALQLRSDFTLADRTLEAPAATQADLLAIDAGHGGG